MSRTDSRRLPQTASSRPPVRCEASHGDVLAVVHAGRLEQHDVLEAAVRQRRRKRASSARSASEPTSRTANGSAATNPRSSGSAVVAEHRDVHGHVARPRRAPSRACVWASLSIEPGVVQQHRHPLPLPALRQQRSGDIRRQDFGGVVAAGPAVLVVGRRGRAAGPRTRRGGRAARTASPASPACRRIVEQIVRDQGTASASPDVPSPSGRTPRAR